MSRSEASVTFSKELDELRSAYLEALPDKIQLIQKAWHSLNQENWNPDSYHSVYRLIHNLAGGAGIYGLHTITKGARHLLHTMKPGMNQMHAPSENLWQDIEQLIYMLETTATKALQKEQQQTHHLRKPPVRPSTTKKVEAEIFLVEDDAEQAAFLRLVLEQAGYRIQHFQSLNHAKIAIEACEPMALLMDMGFPEGELAGAHAIAEIQQSRMMPIPIIFISSRSDMEARLCAVRAGAWHYFAKPLHVSSLISLLGSYTAAKPTVNKHILFVDDDPAISTLFASHLQKEEGIYTSLLYEPLKLFDALSEQKPDLILLDYHMPDCNGLELAAVIRQHESYKSIPIIFLTEETHIETQLTALHLGSDDYFPKSMGPERLVIAVQACFDRLERLNKQLSVSWNAN